MTESTRDEQHLVARLRQGDESAFTTLIVSAIHQLPERQRRVVVLRDALGWSSEEVCNVLVLNETNQRVLLHRARSRLRALLEHNQANH